MIRVCCIHAGDGCDAGAVRAACGHALPAWVGDVRAHAAPRPGLRAHQHPVHVPPRRTAAERAVERSGPCGARRVAAHAVCRGVRRACGWMSCACCSCWLLLYPRHGMRTVASASDGTLRYAVGVCFEATRATLGETVSAERGWQVCAVHQHSAPCGRGRGRCGRRKRCIRGTAFPRDGRRVPASMGRCCRLRCTRGIRCCAMPSRWRRSTRAHAPARVTTGLRINTSSVFAFVLLGRGSLDDLRQQLWQLRAPTPIKAKMAWYCEIVFMFW